MRTSTLRIYGDWMTGRGNKATDRWKMLNGYKLGLDGESFMKILFSHFMQCRWWSHNVHNQCPLSANRRTYSFWHLAIHLLQSSVRAWASSWPAAPRGDGTRTTTRRGLLCRKAEHLCERRERQFITDRLAATESMLNSIVNY